MMEAWLKKFHEQFWELLRMYDISVCKMSSDLGISHTVIYAFMNNPLKKTSYRTVSKFVDYVEKYANEYGESLIDELGPIL